MDTVRDLFKMDTLVLCQYKKRAESLPLFALYCSQKRNKEVYQVYQVYQVYEAENFDLDNESHIYSQKQNR